MEEKRHWWAETLRRVRRSLLENWEMKTPERSSAAILAVRLAGRRLVVAVVEDGVEEDVRHVSGLCLAQQHCDASPGEPNWLICDLSSRYPQGV
jgi:hypothetical protein